MLVKWMTRGVGRDVLLMLATEFLGEISSSWCAEWGLSEWPAGKNLRQSVGGYKRSIP